MYVILISLIAAILLPLIFWYFDRIKYKGISKIPGPPEFLCFGNLFEFGNSLYDVFNALVRINKEYGPIVRIWEGPLVLRVMLSDPSYIEVILSSQVHIEKPVNYDLFKPWIGLGLITSGGSYWRRHRKIVAPTLHFKILDGFLDAFNSCSNTLMEIFKKESNKDINVFPFLKANALDAICETSMGVKINAQLKENSEYVRAIQTFMEVLMTRYFSFFKRFNCIYKLTNDYVREQESLKILNGMTQKVVEDRKKERENIDSMNKSEKDQEFGIKKKTALLDLLLNLKNEDSFTEKEIRDEINTFFFAGHDTVSSVLSFCLFEVAKHPEMQQLMLEEIQSVAGNDKTTPFTMQHLQEFHFMERFIKEVMRFYPPVPFYERQLYEDVEIDKHKIPKGSRIMIFAFGVHRNEKYYPNPDIFDPDRFLAENVATRHPFSFIPFSAGPRNCVGQRFAMVEMKITLANVIRNFILQPIVPEHKLKLANDAILKSLNGLPVRMKVRN